jgi:hypothetical protein
MQLHSLTLPALAALFVAFVPAAEAPHFAPAEGSKITRTISVTSHLVSESMKALVNGEEQPLPDTEGFITIEGTNDIVVKDEFVKMGKGRPQELHRTFEKLAGTENQIIKGSEEDSHEKKQESGLADKTVVFKWNEGDDAYDRAFGEDGGDEDLLEGLDEDMDLRKFLPESASAAEGSSWTVKGEAANAFLFPAGDLKLQSDDDDDENKSSKELDVHLRENLKGSIQVTYKGTREEDGRKVGILELKGNVESNAETTDSDDMSTTLKLGAEVKGEILWDVSANRVHSASVTFDQKVHYKVEGSYDGQKVEQMVDFVGPTKFELKVTK